MSIEIYYGRNFAKVGDKFIPMILHGSSNCTEYIGGREVPERNWSSVCLDFLCTENEMMAKIDSYTDPYGEWFRKGSRNGEWIDKEGFKKICKNACKDAHTVEEFSEAHYPINVKICKWEEYNYFEKFDRCVFTTQEFNCWYEEVKPFIENEGFYPRCTVSSREQVKFGKTTPKTFPCVLKMKTEYLMDKEGYNGKYNIWCHDKAQAKVFTSQEEIDAVLPLVSGLWNRTYSFVSADATTKEKPYVVQVTSGVYSGHYIKKKSSARIFFCTNPKNARSFSYEKEAEKYMNGISCSAISEMKVVRIEG